jgi:hypothetical protein
VDRASISYAQRGGATPQAEISVLSACYQFILDCHAKKEATRPGSPDDGTKVKEDSANGHRRT